jgi:large subunit ribosomal protein L31
MKKNTHPEYQDVLFVDSSTGHKFVVGSTIKSKETGEFEGKTYPMVRLPTSSYSHPFFTKSNQFVDAEGRLDKFAKKYAKAAAQPVQAKPQEEDTKKSVKRKK